MARPRKNSNVLDLQGAFKKDPKRKRTPPKPVKDVGDPPSWMPKHLKVIWHELLDNLDDGWVKRPDTPALEVLTMMVWDFRNTSKKALTGKVQMPASFYNSLMNALGKMGMTPTDREKIAAAPPEEEGDWDEYDEPSQRA